MKQKILLTGASGFIGSNFIEKYSSSASLILLVRKISSKFKSLKQIKVDITNDQNVDNVLGKNDGIVLHLAAKTHIDNCQKDKHLKKNGETWRVNVIGTRNIASACKKYYKKLFFLSTECIFDGKKGNYKEDDLPNPINWYGQTKLEAENIIRKSVKDYCILRSVVAYGDNIYHPADFFWKAYSILKNNKPLTAVDNQYINYTFIGDLVDAIKRLIDAHKSGIYHYAGSEILTPFNFAQKIKNYYELKGNIKPVSLEKYFKKKAKLRLENATLSVAKIKKELNLQTKKVNTALSMLKPKL